jgi:hypothetical protein
MPTKSQLKAEALGYTGSAITILFSFTLTEWLAIMGGLFAAVTFIHSRILHLRDDRRKREAHDADMMLRGLYEEEFNERKTGRERRGLLERPEMLSRLEALLNEEEGGNKNVQTP